MIRLVCKNCRAALRVPASRAGEALRCPRCGKAVHASADASALTPAPAATRGDRKKACDRAEDDPLEYLAPPQAPDEIGRLGAYRVLSVLGSGGMGNVLLAQDTKLRRQVALKVLKKSQAEVPANRERFLREAQAAAAIEHDHIVPIYEVNEDRGVPFLAMKLLVGESLEDRIEREGKLPVEEVIRVGREIAEGLAAAHERGLIHRDVKPANVWLEEGPDRVKIVDFGLALARDGGEDDGRLTGENYLVGTPYYMSPEQASGDIPLDPRTDLFSLGVVLYRMATGELPFTGKKTINVLAALASKTPPAPVELNPALPRRLSAFIMTLMAKDPDDRPKNARVVVAAFVDLAEAVAADADEDGPVVELEPVEPEPGAAGAGGAESKPRSGRSPRPPSGRRGRRGKAPRRADPEDAEDRMARRAIQFAVFAGVCVFILLAYLVVRTLFFKKRLAEAPGRTAVFTTKGPACPSPLPPPPKIASTWSPSPRTPMTSRSPAAAPSPGWSSRATASASST